MKLTFESATPCRHCGRTLRYLEGHGCVWCIENAQQVAAEKRAARKQLKAIRRTVMLSPWDKNLTIGI